jgi:NADH-quinone oxidoreductase subunit J
MAWDAIFFYLLAIISILAALGMVIARNPVHSAIFLVLTLFNTAGVFVMLGAEFIAAAQVIVYAGAVLVLMLFFLMLIDPQNLPERRGGHPIQRIVGPLLGLILLLEVGAAILSRAIVGTPFSNPPIGLPATPEYIAREGGSTQAIGNLLYSQYLLPFEVVSLVLTVGIIGAIVLALPERLGERLGTISLGHPRGTDIALPEGPSTASPTTRADERATAALEATREIILVKDPDLYTRVGSRETAPPEHR